MIILFLMLLTYFNEVTGKHFAIQLMFKIKCLFEMVIS